MHLVASSWYVRPSVRLCALSRMNSLTYVVVTLSFNGNYKSTKFVCLSVISGRLRLRQRTTVDRLLILLRGQSLMIWGDGGKIPHPYLLQGHRGPI